MSIDRALQRLWYGEFRLALLPLIPLSWVFAVIVAVRRAAYRYGVLRSHRVAVPVIVVGNITVGGTGKTPFTIWLADQLAARGLKVGVVLRGYGGASTTWPRQVTRDSSWHEVGDEGCLIAMRTSAIVVAGPDRVADARLAIELGAQVVLSDDGLQHYRLARDAEILVMDGTRKLGNGRLLPAGPLRESASRLRSVDLQVITQRSPQGSEQPSIESRVPMVVARPTVRVAVNLVNGESRSLASFAGSSVHAVAAIGHPEGFFDALRALGLQVRGHAFPDHAQLAREHVVFDDAAPVLMTEKDAVKCAAVADERHWAVPLHVELNAADAASVSALLERIVRKAA
jgi:tetraacyldisaccharide 4'-kinase